MGHTPTFDKMVSRCGGKIIIIDTGISHAYGGVLSALDIVYTLSPITDIGSASSASGSRQPGAKLMKEEKKKITSYLEREVITAVYPDKRVLLVSEEREVSGAF